MNPTLSDAEIASLDILSTSHAPTHQPQAALSSDTARIEHSPTIVAQLEDMAFDYIVIGGGTAGLVVATRLAERDGVTVCVLEAGTTHVNDILVDVPGLYGQAMGRTSYDWAFKTVPQQHLVERQIDSSAGKVLGGSSAINFLVRMRASRAEYDSWEELGNIGWNWNGLLEHFKRTEHYVAPIWGTNQIFPGITKAQDEEAQKEEPDFVGHDGPVWHTYNQLYTEALEPTIRGLNSLGIRTNRIPNYGDATGIFNIGTAVDRSLGTRSFAANSYLKSGKEQLKNLFVLKECQVSKILFEPQQSKGDVTASGVQFTYLPPGSAEPIITTLRARKEVILSAGTYNTPKLLELSGVGNPQVLHKYEIPVVVDLPGVGENLQEHLYVPSDFVVKDNVFTLDRMRTDKQYAAEQLQEYITKRTGAYATTVSAYGYVKLNQIMSVDELKKMKAELERELHAMESTQTPLQKAQYAIQRKLFDEKAVGDVELIMVPHVFANVDPPQDKSFISIVAAITRPISRGSVHIKSNKCDDPPEIDPKYLTSPFDTKCLAKTMQFVRKLSETDEMKGILKEPSLPGSNITSEQQFIEYARRNAVSLQHPIGTCAMARRELGGVVDPDLHVYGTKNLRIADMSVAPMHIAAHTMDTAYAIGEKAASLIK